MKMLIAGVKAQSGKTKADRDYVFSEAYVLLPLEAINFGSHRSIVFGYEPVTMKLVDGLIGEFAHFRFPCVLEVEQINKKFRDTVEVFISSVSRVEPALKPVDAAKAS